MSRWNLLTLGLRAIGGSELLSKNDEVDANSSSSGVPNNSYKTLFLNFPVLFVKLASEDYLSSVQVIGCNLYFAFS